MVTLDDYLRDLPLKQQVETLREYLAVAERECDELREQVARLEEERTDCQCESNRRRGALEKYGVHAFRCHSYANDSGCDCGLAEALK